MLVRAARENLAESVPESVSKRREQRALGLPKLASNRQPVYRAKVKTLQGPYRPPATSLPILQTLREIRVFRKV